MSETGSQGILEAARAEFARIADVKKLLDADVEVSAAALTAEQAIGQPTRRDFPIVEGKEVLVEATVNGAKGHAFTDSPRAFKGTLRDVMERPLSSNADRAAFIAVLNAVLRSIGMLEASLHCKDDDPEECAKELASHVRERWGIAKVGLIGLNPAIAEALVAAFGPDNVRITDLNRKTIGAVRFGVRVWDGRTETEELIRQSEGVVITGTTLVNGTFDGIYDWIQRLKKEYLVFGVTAAGVCRLLGMNRMCPYCRSE
jgi:uncharacterized protein (DUF4213/DUF364 family)